jgi:hypothetical protein
MAVGDRSSLNMTTRAPARPADRAGYHGSMNKPLY